MYHALLMGVVNGVANLDEQLEALSRVETVLVAVIGNFDSPDQLHYEIGSPRPGRAGVEDFSNIGMVHHRQGLALGLKLRDDIARVHPKLDDFQSDAPTHGG